LPLLFPLRHRTRGDSLNHEQDAHATPEAGALFLFMHVRLVLHVMKMLEHADLLNANLLLNTGPLWDGSIDPVDKKTLLEVGRHLNRS
jgi:alpha-L-fucosidase